MKPVLFPPTDRPTGFTARVTSIRAAGVWLAVALAAGTFSARAATFTVLNNNDSGADSLRAAIALAAGNAGADTIEFDASLNNATITLASELTVGTDLIIDASALPDGITIDGNGASQVFYVNNGYVVAPLWPVVEMRNLSITGGGNAGFGPGIGNYGDLTLIDCTISGNTSTFRGGGIYNNAQLTASRCTISGNAAAPGQPGGGIYLTSASVSTFTNSTITDNQTDNASGTAFYVEGPSFTLTLDHCTVSRNSAVNTSSARASIFLNGDEAGAVTIRNSIVAGNLPSSSPAFSYDGSGTTWTIEGVNIIGNNESVATQFQFPATAGLIGTTSSPVDPLLDALADNGGLTQTMALQTGSPADRCRQRCRAVHRPARLLAQRVARHRCVRGSFVRCQPDRPGPERRDLLPGL